MENTSPQENPQPQPSNNPPSENTPKENIQPSSSNPSSINPQQQKSSFNKPNERFKTKVKKIFLYNKFYLKKKNYRT